MRYSNIVYEIGRNNHPKKAYLQNQKFLHEDVHSNTAALCYKLALVRH